MTIFTQINTKIPDTKLASEAHDICGSIQPNCFITTRIVFTCSRRNRGARRVCALMQNSSMSVPHSMAC